MREKSKREEGRKEKRTENKVVKRGREGEGTKIKMEITVLVKTFG